MQDHESNANMTRLQWACRRGMLELDVLLGNFLKEAYPTLPESDKRLFEALLLQNDQQLFNWLLGAETPEDANIRKIIQLIQHHARNRIQH